MASVLPTDKVVEILIGGVWTEITNHVFGEGRGGVEISRGKANEQANLFPTKSKLEINNRDGRYSPRNPTGPHFGLIGRNTPIRVSVTETLDTAPSVDASSFFSGTATGDFSFTHTPKGAPAGVLVFVSQIVGITDEVVGVTYGGKAMTEVALSPLIVDAGTEEGVLYGYFLGADIPIGPQTVAVDVNATGSTKDAVCFSLVADSTTTVIEDTSVLDAASQADPSVSLTTTVKTFIAASLLSGHDATSSLTPVAPATSLSGIGNQDFGTQVCMYLFHPDAVAAGSPTIAATATAEEAGMLAVAVKNGPDIARVHGEIVAWPQEWDKTGTDVWVPIEAAGITRRLGQGVSPLRSSMHRFVTRNNPAGYWPLDTGRLGATGKSAVGGQEATLSPDIARANRLGFGLQVANIATSQTTTSNNYTDLTTVGPEVDVTVGISGRALVIWSAQIAANGSAGSNAFMSVAVSGATTVAASDASAIIADNIVKTYTRVELFSGLNPGTNTFTAKYRKNTAATDAFFSDRTLAVIPF